MTTELTAPQRKALEIVRDHPNITGHRFAELMWPDAAGWKKYSKAGVKGTRQGVGMWLRGGAYLSQLANKRLVTKASLLRFERLTYYYNLSFDGRQALRPLAPSS